MSMSKTNPRMNPRVMQMMEARAAAQPAPTPVAPGMKKGGKVKKMARGGGIESRGKTVGKMC